MQDRGAPITSLLTCNVLSLVYLEESENIETALAYEEYFCISFLGAARCFAEMEEFELAVSVMEDAVEAWHLQARRIAGDLLLDSPWQFLSRYHTREVPVQTFTDWLDFAYNKNRGIQWLDVFRRMGRNDVDHVNKRLEAAKKYNNRSADDAKESLGKARVLNRFIHRSSVLKGYTGQYELLKQAGLRPSAFDKMISQIAKEHGTDGFLVLKPRDSNGRAE